MQFNFNPKVLFRKLSVWATERERVGINNKGNSHTLSSLSDNSPEPLSASLYWDGRGRRWVGDGVILRSESAGI